MNGQYLMNKQVSVQYAYKKDGKGERHGDEAERMLAAQARKHNVRPPTQQPPPTQFTGVSSGPSATPTMPNSEALRPASTGPQVPDLTAGRTLPASGSYQNVPPQNRPPPPASSLATPPPGLPARPPPSQAGYGGPQSFMPPGFNSANQPPAFTPQNAPPPGFVAPGFVPAAGGPPLPPGFQQPGFGTGR